MFSQILSVPFRELQLSLYVKCEQAVLAIALEELFDYVISRALVKSGEDSSVVHVDKTAVMSERDCHGQVYPCRERSTPLLCKLTARLRSSGFESVEEQAVLDLILPFGYPANQVGSGYREADRDFTGSSGIRFLIEITGARVGDIWGYRLQLLRH